MAKKTFEVNVCRIAYAYHTITVEAETEQEARNLAVDEAGNHLYNEKHVDYEAQEVTEVIDLDAAKVDSPEKPIDELILQRIYNKLGEFTANDEDEYPEIIKELREGLALEPNEMVDYLETITMWEKVEFSFTVKEFCELIGLS